MGRYRKRKKKENRMGKLCVSGIVFMFLIVMSIQIVKLYKEDQTYIAKEKELNEQLEDATEEQQQLADYEQYTQSQQYIEEVAKSKLGLVYNNEIVFKEQDTEDGKKKMGIVRPLPVRSGFFVMTTADLKRDAERIPSL